MPYDKQKLGHGSNAKVRLSSLDEGVCRHQALLFQTLIQAVGIRSQLIKGELNGGGHATNIVEVDGKWYIYDVTNPDIMNRQQRQWRAGRFPIDRPPRPGEYKTYNVTGRHTGRSRVYTSRDDYSWRILPVRR